MDIHIYGTIGKLLIKIFGEPVIYDAIIKIRTLEINKHFYPWLGMYT